MVEKLPPLIREIIELASFCIYPKDIKITINELLSKAGYKIHIVLGGVIPKIKGLEKLPPMFTLGLGPLGVLPPIGFIFVTEDFYKWSFKEHFMVYVAHEIGHIIKWHSLSNPFKILDIVLKNILSEKDYNFFKGFKNIIKALWFVYLQKRPPEEEITAKQELEADKFALELINNKELVLSALRKLSEVCLDGLSHFTDVGFKIPILTMRERIKHIEEI